MVHPAEQCQGPAAHQRSAAGAAAGDSARAALAAADPAAAAAGVLVVRIHLRLVGRRVIGRWVIGCRVGSGFLGSGGRQRKQQPDPAVTRSATRPAAAGDRGARAGAGRTTAVGGCRPAPTAPGCTGATSPTGTGPRAAPATGGRAAPAAGTVVGWRCG